jgi:Fe-S oxidoreductase
MEPVKMLRVLRRFRDQKPRDFRPPLGEKKKEILESGAALVATDCPGCLFQLRSGLKKEGAPLQSYHTAEILAQAIEKDSTK